MTSRTGPCNNSDGKPKRRYVEKADARKACRLARGRTGYRPKRFYRCSECFCWHLTSQQRAPIRKRGRP